MHMYYWRDCDTDRQVDIVSHCIGCGSDVTEGSDISARGGWATVRKSVILMMPTGAWVYDSRSVEKYFSSLHQQGRQLAVF